MVPKLSTIPLFASLTLLPSLYIKLAVFPNVSLCLSQIGSGIGRMILKEEMKARSGSYDNDPWGSARNSRSGSKETLNTTGHSTTAYNNTVNGCKDPPSPPHTFPPFVSCTFCFCKFMHLWLCPSNCAAVSVFLPLWSYVCMSPQGIFYEIQYLLSSRFWARAVKLWMQDREGHGCCRGGGVEGVGVLLWLKDVKRVERLLSNLS